MSKYFDDEVVPHVRVDGEWVPMSQVEFLDISEDLQGFDIVTFNFEGKQYQSRVHNRVDLSTNNL